MKFGFELEFKSPRSRFSLADMLVLELHSPDYTNWSLGTDMSLRAKVGQHSLELRSPILEQYPHEAANRILTVLKSLKCDVSGSCGIHWHFSTEDLISDNQRSLMNDKIIAKFKKSVKKCRTSYCLSSPDTRYTPVRRISKNHVEFRIFNSSLNPRFVFQSWKASQEIFTSSL